MASNAIFFAWNRSIPGRERISSQHFGEFSEYLQGLKNQGTIESFDAVFLTPHGGDMNGFFLIRGQTGKLDGLISSEQWESHMTRAMHHLDSSGAVRALTGNEVMNRMRLWTESIPD